MTFKLKPIGVTVLLSVLCYAASACRSSSSSDSPAKSLDDTALAVSCSKGNRYRLDDKSIIHWQMGKLVKGNPTPILVDGTLAVDGLWTFTGGNIQSSTAEFIFQASSVKSDAALRDERLKTFFFLMPENLPVKLSIKLWEAKMSKLKDGEATELVAIGKLIIAGHESNVLKIPLVVRMEGSPISVKTEDAFRLNLRSNEKGNGIDMSDRLNELLTQVPGVGLYDYTDIKLNLLFKPFGC